MDEIESPIEHLNEELHHAVVHAKENWLKWSALLSALLAVLAAIAGMQSGHEVNAAMIDQIKSSDAWGYYQAKGIKILIVESQLTQNGQTQQKVEKYHEEQEAIKRDAEAKVMASERHLYGHEILARAVTLFQVAIAMTAIAVLPCRKHFLLFSVGLGLVGNFFFAQYWLL